MIDVKFAAEDGTDLFSAMMPEVPRPGDRILQIPEEGLGHGIRYGIVRIMYRINSADGRYHCVGCVAVVAREG